MSPLISYVTRNFARRSLATIDTANSILREYAAQGYDLTLRQLYYQFVARGYIPNSDREYKKLGSVVNDARLAGMIDWDSIVDRTRYLRAVSTWGSPGSIIRGAANSYQRDLWATQDVRFEVWIEKDALVGVIERACEDLRIPFLSCRGYTSQSEMWRAAQRHASIIDGGQNVIVLHLGDHDPSGIDMSRDIEDRIRDFIYSDGSDVEMWSMQRLALNWDQVEQYQPPPNPAKLTDSRGAGYVERFGSKSWELDALEPTVIGRLIQDAVFADRDAQLWADAHLEELEEIASLELAAGRWVEVAQYLRDNPSE